jgi:hypothetical protein
MSDRYPSGVPSRFSETGRKTKPKRLQVSGAFLEKLVPPGWGW